MALAINRTLRKIKNVVLGDNSTYREKNASLPKNSPVPAFIELPGPWDVWEWWAGCGAVTKACQKLHLRCGPAVSHSTGWCLKLPHHRQRLKELLIKHAPAVLFAAPTCGPWSTANTTMDPQIKLMLRCEEQEAFDFYLECATLQHLAGRTYLYEQPRTSELLRTPQAQKHAKLINATDHRLCMCAHELVDPENGLYSMKQTILRGTCPLTKRVVRWCPGVTKDHTHQILQGRLLNGQLRTAHAQSYTRVFSERLAKDIRGFVKNETSTFPAFTGPNPAWKPRLTDDYSDDEDQQASKDPYEAADVSEPTQSAAERVERHMQEARARRHASSSSMPATPIPLQSDQIPHLQPTAKRLAKPLSQVPNTPIDLEQPLV